MDHIKYSLLIATLNRKKLLRRCLDSLYNQTYKNYEIIIVDQSDEIDCELEQESRVKYIHISERGLSHSRNVGLSVVAGDYVCLIDDDAVYDKNYLEAANDYLVNSKKNIGIISGRGRDPETGNYLLPSMKDDQIRILGWRQLFSYCMSAIMVIKREILIEGFDTDFGIGAKYGAAEDTDILIRTFLRHYTVVYNPKMNLFHKSGSNNDVDLDKVYKYSIGIGAIFKKYYLSHSKILFLSLFLYSFSRSIVGCLAYILGKRKYIRSYYAIRGKIRGFRDYVPGPNSKY